MKKKRGQITTFIVMGMIIILLLSIFIYLRQSTTFFNPEKVLPAEFVPVKRYVEQCVETTAKDAVFLASMQGGYVELPLWIESDPDSYVGEGLKIPLWFYNGQNRMPELGDIEDGIAEHVNSNLKNCLGNFEGFSEQFDIMEIAEPVTTVSISDDNIFIRTEYPLKIANKQGTETTDWEDFVSTFEDSLGKKYRLASLIMNHENENSFLEALTMEMIAASDFPNEGLELTCGKREYDIDEDLVPSLKLMLLANLRYLTFENTQTRELPTEYHENLYRFTVTRKDFSDLRVDAMFDRDSDIIMDVYPQENRIVEPVNLNVPFINTCFKIYNHKYDIYYPLTFQIIDQGEEPSYFLFSTPVVIDNSAPNRVYGIREPLIEDTINQGDYCEDKQFMLNVYAIDEYTNEFIPNADIKFQCVRFMCDMGTTSIRTIDDGLVPDASDFVLETEFPACGGGFLIAEKEGYMRGFTEDILTGEVTITGETHVYEGEQHNIYMTPLKTLDYRVLVVEFEGNETIPNIRELEDDEIAIIKLTNEDKDYSETLIYPFEYNLYSNITLIVGDYTYGIDITLMQNETYTGGLIGDWDTTGNSIYSAERIDFYVLKKTEDPVETNYVGLAELIDLASLDYTPRIR